MNLSVVKVSSVAFSLVFFPLVAFELAFGSYNLFSNALVIIPVAFHEIGHLAFGSIVSPLFSAILPISFLAVPLHFLGGFFFNAIAGILLVGIALFAFSKIYSGSLSAKHKQVAFSFLFIGYLNILMVPYTLTHLNHVVGRGLDFSMASFLLALSLDQLLFWLLAVGWLTLSLAVLINAFFVFRKP